MGSCWFKGCDLAERFTHTEVSPLVEGGELRGQMWLVWDWDQRRPIDVYVPEKTDEDFIYEALAKFIDNLPPDVVQVELDKEGALVSSSSNIQLDRSWIPFYPLRTEFPQPVATVRRRDLTELDRLGLQVDLVAYSPRAGETRQTVFKYYVNEDNVALWWHEANCIMRMPPHPNIVPFDALVVDSIEGVDRVVGFTTHYIPGGTLFENKTRVFKLKYVQDLIDVVDHLNLRLGIVHGDICPWNLLIDAGWKGDEDNNLEFLYEADRNDVKFVIFTVYELITREFNFRREFYPDELDASKVMEQETWEQHQDSKLDSPVDEYRRVLADWVRERAQTDKQIDHFTKASQPLDWPRLRVDDPFLDQDWSPLRRKGRMREVMIKLGKDYLKWDRPPTRALPLPKGKRLLATGQVVEDGDVANISNAPPTRPTPDPSTVASTQRQVVQDGTVTGASTKRQAPRSGDGADASTSGPPHEKTKVIKR